MDNSVNRTFAKSPVVFSFECSVFRKMRFYTVYCLLKTENLDFAKVQPVKTDMATRILLLRQAVTYRPVFPIFSKTWGKEQESKEAAAHCPEILNEIKLTLQESGRRLAMFVRRRKKSR
jgi:hypothetical protein